MPPVDMDAFYNSIETKSFEPIRDMDYDQAYGLWDSETKALMDISSLKSLFFTEDWVYILVSKYANRIAGQPLRIMRKEIRDGKTVIEPAEGHQLMQVFKQPNEQQDYYQWMNCIVTDLTLLGNSICWHAKASNQIIFIPAELVTMQFKENKVSSYDVRRMNQAGGLATEKPVLSLEPQSVGHFRRPNPASLYWGLSPFVPGRKSILFNRYSSEFLNNFYIKGAQPGLVIELLDGAVEKDALRLLRSMELSYTGRKNQRRNMVLPKNTKATPMTMSLADTELKDYIALNRDNIINLLEVPKHELSLAASGSLGSEEYKTALRNFWRGPLRSTMDSITGVLNKMFASELGEGFEIQFDLSDVEALQDDEKSKASLASEMLKTHTLNEVRALVYNLQPVIGGDFVGQAPIPQFETFQKPLDETKKPPTGLAIAPINQTIDQSIDQSIDQPIDAKAVMLKANADKFMTLKAQDPKWFEDREAAQSQDFDRASVGVEKNFLKILGEQISDVLPIVRDFLKEEKALTTKEKSKTELKRDITRALNKYEDDYINGNLEVLNTTLDVGYSTALKVPFNIPDMAKIEAMRVRNEERRKDQLAGRQVEIFSGINKTTARQITDRIEAGLEAQETLQEIITSIKNNFTNIDNIKQRASVIARTETLTASSIGQWAAMNDVEKVLPGTKKMWINAGDDRVRGNPGGLYPDSKADHWALQGEVRSVKKKFSNKLMVPRDPDGPPHETIQCFPGDILISAKSVKKIFRRWFDGELVSVKTSSGGAITGTMNHPVLTQRGWVALSCLTKNDYLVKASVGKSLVSNNDVKVMLSSFEKVFESFSKHFMNVRTIAGSADFHGDISARNVDVINVEGFLTDNIKSSIKKDLENLSFSKSNFTKCDSLSLRGEEHSGLFDGSSSCGLMSGGGLSNSLGGIHSRPLDQFGLTLSETLKTDGLNPPIECGSRDTIIFRELVNANFFDKVLMDNIIDIDRINFSGHVYNLETKENMYIANEYVSHNCRCSVIMIPPGDAERLGIEELNTEVTE